MNSSKDVIIHGILIDDKCYSGALIPLTCGAPPDLLTDLSRIFNSGIPAVCNISATEANFQAYYDYGNHSTVALEPTKTYQALVKDNKKGYTLLFDQRLIPFLLHCHVTPQGIIDQENPLQKPATNLR